MREVTQPVRARGTTLSAVAVVAALTALLAFAPIASATSDPLASGTTTLTLKKGFQKKLNNRKIRLVKWGSGKIKNRNVMLGVSGGKLDPLTGEGTVEQSGGFKFKYRKRTVPITELTIDRTGKAAFAKIANARMKLGFLGKYSYAREGFGVNVNAAKLKLTGKAARRINNKLGMKKEQPIKGGRVMSNAYSATQPKTVAVLAEGKADLATDETTVKKFVLAPPSGFLVSIETFPPAETEKVLNPFTPVLKFPIGGGTIAPDANGGVVQTTGGVKLVQTLGLEKTTTMTLSNIWVDLDAKTATVEVSVTSTISPELNLGDLGRSSIANLNLTGATIVSDPANRKVSVLNATATLQAVTAETLNSVFGAPFDAEKLPHPTFAEGDALGSFSFVAQTQ